MESEDHSTEMNLSSFNLLPIGLVRSPRHEAIDDDWGSIESMIALDPGRFQPSSLEGLDEFSHIEVVFVFDQVNEASIQTGSRRPRNNPEWPEVGIFAQRAKARPNRIGVTVCELLGIEGIVLNVRGLDAIARTPVLDIKPYMTEFAPRGPTHQPGWAHELMARYWD